MKTRVWLILVWLAVTLVARGEPGALDSGFGDGGVLVLPLAGAANAVVSLEDGKIIAGGPFGVVRLHQDGGLDASFGQGGQAVVSLTNQARSVSALAVQPDGKIVVAVGDKLARLLASGTLDTDFGENGFSLGAVATNRTDSIVAVALQPDGKILAVGTSTLKSGGGIAFLVKRFGSNGINDPDFGSNGRALADFNDARSFGRAVLLQPDGGIVIGGGATFNERITFGLARFTGNGLLDSSFGDGGEVVIPFPGSNFSQINEVALQSDGRIIGAGISNSTNSSDFAMVRLNQDGSLDDSFGVHGVQRTDFSAKSSDIGVGVAVLPDDSLVMAGSTGPTVFKRQFAIARYDRDGQLAENFGTGGWVSTQFPLSHADEANTLALTGDGRIILAGRSLKNGVDSAAFARYHVQDLNAVEVATADPVAVGDTIYYDVLVENDRLQTVTGVRLMDRLPSSVDFQSVFATQGSCTNLGGQIICDLGTLAAGGQAQVTIFASMHATAHLCNTVSVSANETDPFLTNSAVACATIDVARERPQNLAVTAIRAPKRVTLTATRPTADWPVAVEIQNRSPHVATITNLEGLVDLEVRSLTNSCPDLVPVLLTLARLPVVLAPKAKMTVYYQVTVSTNCVPDPLRTSSTGLHNDYSYAARAHQDLINDFRDTFPEDDTCPRLSSGIVTTAGGPIKDRGCGGKRFHAGFGAPVVTDVIMK